MKSDNGRSVRVADIRIKQAHCGNRPISVIRSARSERLNSASRPLNVLHKIPASGWAPIFSMRLQMTPSIAFEIAAESDFAHHSLLASKLGKNASTILGAIHTGGFAARCCPSYLAKEVSTTPRQFRPYCHCLRFLPACERKKKSVGDDFSLSASMNSLVTKGEVIARSNAL